MGPTQHLRRAANPVGSGQVEVCGTRHPSAPRRYREISTAAPACDERPHEPLTFVAEEHACRRAERTRTPPPQRGQRLRTLPCRRVGVSRRLQPRPLRGHLPRPGRVSARMSEWHSRATLAAVLPRRGGRRSGAERARQPGRRRRDMAAEHRANVRAALYELPPRTARGEGRRSPRCSRGLSWDPRTESQRRNPANARVPKQGDSALPARRARPMSSGQKSHLVGRR